MLFNRQEIAEQEKQEVGRKTCKLRWEVLEKQREGKADPTFFLPEVSLAAGDDTAPCVLQ